MAWADRCHSHFQKVASDNQALFGIVQGGIYPDLRQASVEHLKKLGFPGYAIGGLAVGEPNELMYEVIDRLEPHLPEDRPRYLMGVGTPENLIECVALGIDMFDCVMPTRHARNGSLFTMDGQISIKNARYKEDPNPIDSKCGCPVCQTYSRAYLRHLFLAKEILASVLNTMHNLYFYLDTMRRIRQAIEFHNYDEFLADIRRRSSSAIEE